MHQHTLTIIADCDDGEDACYLALTPAGSEPPLIRTTQRVNDYIVVDLDKDGALVGIELWDLARTALLRNGLIAEEKPDV